MSERMIAMASNKFQRKVSERNLKSIKLMFLIKRKYRNIMLSISSSNADLSKPSFYFIVFSVVNLEMEKKSETLFDWLVGWFYGHH